MKTVQLEWGPVGAATLAESCDVLVVVDVLSFTTCVSIACARRGTVWPHRWRDDSAAVRAGELGAVVAEPRGSPLSLSPVSLLALPTGTRLLLPSPNGSTIAAAAAGSGRTVVAACLRNAGAVARWLVATGGTVGLVSAGERTPPPPHSRRVRAASRAGPRPSRRPPGPRTPAAASRPARRGVVGGQVARLLLRPRARRRGLWRRRAGSAEEDADDVVPVLRGGAFTADANVVP